MRVEILLFAGLRDALGGPRVVLELPAGTTGTELIARLCSLHPQHAGLLRSCRIAQGVEFLDERSPVQGPEIALIPPVSGGLEPAAVRLTHDPLDGELLKQAAYRRGAGAVVVFEGTVRSPSEGKDVLYLEYEAHEPMALAQMTRILEEARTQWPLAAAFLHHRLGRIEVGEASVLAVASAAHRGEAFTACRHLIERLKAQVPIWKKEVFTDGSTWVGAPGECAHPEVTAHPETTVHPEAT